MTVIAPPDQQDSPLARAEQAFREVREQEDALFAKRRALGDTLTREGKLTREQRSTLAGVNRDLKALAPKVKRASKALTREQVHEQKRIDAATAKRERAAEVARKKARVAVERKVKQMEARSYKAANFAQLPGKSKPSKTAAKPNTTRPLLEQAFLTQDGKGKDARWVLVTTDSYALSVVPLEVSNEKAVRETLIPPEALRAIEKAGAFRVTPKGAIQPLKVEAMTTHVQVGEQSGTPRQWTAERAGTAYMENDQAFMARYPDGRRGSFPAWKQLVVPEPSQRNRFEATFSADLLRNVAEALGDGGVVTLQFDLSKAGKASEGRRQGKGPFRVVGRTDAFAMLMPVRRD